MNNRKLKIALFGCGKMGMHHIQAIKIQENGYLVAVADPSADMGSIKEHLDDSVSLYKDPESMLKEVKPDVVHIATPPETHVELALLAIEHGSHIYVEKPFALNQEDAETVLQKADEKGLSVCAAHQVQFQDSGRKYKEYIKLTGEAVHIESYFSFKTVRRYTPVEQLIDILPHPVYLLLGAFELSDNQEKYPVEMKALKVDAKGEVHAIFSHKDTTGVLVVTLNGRPIESYLKLICKNGSIVADFILSGVNKLPGPGVSALAQVILPFSKARQLVFGTISTIFKMVFKKHKSYAGLGELVGEFYSSIQEKKPSPVSHNSIVDTVRICEEIGRELLKNDDLLQASYEENLKQLEAGLPLVDSNKGTILVTGGTGFLGKVLSNELRQSGWNVRVIARKMPNANTRVPGVEYVHGDISQALNKEWFQGVDFVVHLAAETIGGQSEHDKNTIEATRNLITLSSEYGATKFINISSIAVIKPSKEIGGPLNESSEVDSNNIGRGPYVWSKLKAEEIVEDLGEKLGIETKTIRLGPLVDYNSFEPPGRLGRDAGPFFIAMGNPWNRISVCDVTTASNVIRYYITDFEDSPKLLNLVEAKPQKRSYYTKLLKQRRPELSVVWVPDLILRFLSLLLKVVLKIMKPGKKPLDLHAAFSSEQYDTKLASSVIEKARVK
jgi:predicted dehydrogenase/nucleoside-diphosphate-sugar epimerase